MREDVVKFYRCPYRQEELHLQNAAVKAQHVISGQLVSSNGQPYEIKDGIPYLINPAEEQLGPEEKQEADYYESTAAAYDSVIDWLFQSFYEDEDRVRASLVALLDLKPTNRVLETGCGTCRDSLQIAEILDKGELFLQDFSPSMLRLGRQRMENSGAGNKCQVEYFVGNACRLPFPDGFFDAAFHFGGLNLFSDKQQALLEMARVVKVGGKVVVGDESVAPWLREIEYGKILLNSNHLYTYLAPIELLPERARDVCLRWILGNAFYVIDFRVGDGLPPVNLDLPIQGGRGGTHRSRYYGRLEGVTVAAKQKAIAAARRKGLSLHDWLDSIVTSAAERDLQLDGSSETDAEPYKGAIRSGSIDY